MVWASVTEFPHYEVDEEGRVRNTRTGKTLKWVRHNMGYWQVTLCDSGRREIWLVHRLVAQAFLGPEPPGQEVDHVDTDRGNLHLSNLRYVTHAENQLAISQRMTRCRGSGEHEWVEQNIYTNPGNGRRQCIPCMRERQRHRPPRRRVE